MGPEEGGDEADGDVAEPDEVDVGVPDPGDVDVDDPEDPGDAAAEPPLVVPGAGRVIVVVTWRTFVTPQPARAAATAAASTSDRAPVRMLTMVTVTLQVMLYRLVYRRLLARADPERVHVATARALGTLGRIPGVRRLLAALAGRPAPSLAVDTLGLTFPSPLGVAAGMDKNLDWFAELGALGFGYVEVGTVTADPQPGNPRPRIHRLPADRALINSMGFPNAGAEAAARRLARARGRHRDPIVALNVGRTKAATDTTADYRASVGRLAPYADLLVLNVSSPNTPGLRDLQAVDTLRELVAAVRAELQARAVSVPLLVKIAPDLDDAALDALTDAALELGLDGLVCTNTTTSRAGLRSPAALTEQPGGVSGAPLAARSLAVLRRVRAIAGDRLVLVSVGGIETADDALARIRAGATLVQAYTGFVHGGPGWPGEINRGLAQRLHAVGARSIGQLVGTEPTPAALPTRATHAARPTDATHPNAATGPGRSPAH